MTTTRIDDTQIYPGSSNQLLGVNNAGNADEYKTLNGTTHEINIAYATGSITLSTPQAIDTTSSPTFASETLSNTTNQLVLGTTHTTTISSTAPAASRTYTIPDAGGSANVVLDSGNYTIGGTWTFSNAITVTPTTNQLVLGTTRTVTLSATQPATSSRTYTIPDQGANANIVGDQANYTIAGTWTFNNNVTLASSKALIFTDNSTDTVTLEASNSTTSYTLKWPTSQAISTQVLQNDGSGNLSWGAASVPQYVNYVVGTPSGSYSGSTTVFALPFSYTTNGKNLQVFYDGQQLVPTDDYTETSTTSVTTTQALVIGTKIAFRTVTAGSIAAPVNLFREDYVVGTALNNYTGSSTVFNLVNSYNVGGHILLATLDGDVQTAGSTVDYLETNSTTVTFNNALVIGQKVSFIWSATTGASSGTVNSGTSSHLSYYASSGTVLSDASGNTVNGSYTFSGGAGAITLSSSTIAMGSNKITGLAAPSSSGDALSYGNLLNGTTLTLSSTVNSNISFDNTSTHGIVGTTTNDSAASGNMGEYIQANLEVSAGTSTQYKNFTSISLTAGDWDVEIHGQIETNSATISGDCFCAVSLFSNNTTTDHVAPVNQVEIGKPFNSTSDLGFAIPRWRVSVSTTTIVYGKVAITYSAGSPFFNGSISARRVR